MISAHRNAAARNDRGRGPLRLRAPCAKTVGKSAEYAVASSLSGYFYMNLPGTLYRMAENIVFGQPRTHAEFDAAETPTKPSDSG